MRIILINPPFAASSPLEHISPPLGLGYLAAALLEEGHEVQILDASLGGHRRMGKGRYIIGQSWTEIGSRLARIRPDFVGISCPFSSRFPFAQRLVNLARECLPAAKVVMGGLHPSISPVSTLEKASPDYIVIGEAEIAFPELVRSLESGGNPAEIPAVGGFTEAGEEFLNRELNLPQDLDALPYPARGLMDMESYIQQVSGRWSRGKNRQTVMLTSRGCPQSCTFCSVHHVHGRRWRGRSAVNVLDELEHLVRDYRIDSIAFDDDNFSLDRRRLMAICEGMLARDLRLNWLTPNGVSVKTLDREILTLMHQAGCRMLNLAVESGDEHILNQVIRKKQSLEQVRDAAHICAELGIATNAYFVVGMPGETENSIGKSLEFAKSLPFRDVGVFIATPFPGTELYDTCASQGYLDPQSAEFAFFNLPDDAMLHKALIETPVMSRARIEWWGKEFHRRFWAHRFRRNPLLRLRLASGWTLRKIQSVFLR